MSDWAEHVIWWHLHPLTFLGAPRQALPPGAPAEPRLRNLEPWLDYLLELGCNGLALGPIFESETHGYDTVDHYRVDRRLGTEADLRWLLDECRRRGIRVMLDGVFNHVGRGFGRFGDPAYEKWFVRDGDDWANFEGHRHLVVLNHDEPAVAEYVTGVMRHWLDFGVDGWRLDAAYAVPLPFWKRTAGAIDGGWFVGEVIHGDYPAWVRDGGLDSITQYELWKAIWSSLNDLNFFELAWALERHDTFSADFAPMTFAGNHDVTRLASAITDRRHIGLALAVLFTTGGVPSIYAGDEQAFRGVKHDAENGDDENQQLIGLRRRHPWLHRAVTRPLHVANKQLAYEVSAGDHRLIVLLNAADDGHEFALETGPLRALLTHDTIDNGTLVPGPGWSILEPS